MKYEGELLYDEANPENSTLKVTFKTDSIETLVPKFNEHMKRELFDVERYPECADKHEKDKAHLDPRKPTGRIERDQDRSCDNDETACDLARR